jgi:regulator of protease activity HflC (stomatin/prohibitin superfamily)
LNQQVTVNEMLQAAINAEQAGVTVNWKDMTFKVANAATNVIEALEAQLQAQTEEAE